MSLLLVAVCALGGLALLLATLLVVANRTLYVFEDPRIATVEEALPHANCGGCGYPSCHGFAEALVNGDVSPSQCQVSSESQQQDIAQFLNVAVGDRVRSVARLACAGGNHVAVNRATYRGMNTCNAAQQVAGGGKACSWGCLGLGDCAKACTFGAIQMNQNGLPVVDERICTACSDCVVTCPKQLFSLQPVNHALWVACRNQQQGEAVLADCLVGCTACGRCAMDAKDQHLTMLNNLPVVDYQKSLAGREAIERCPTGAIVWVQSDGSVIHGHEAKPHLSQPLPANPS